MNRRSTLFTLLFLLSIGPVLMGIEPSSADDRELKEAGDDDSENENEHEHENQHEHENEHENETEIDDDHGVAREAVDASRAISLGQMLEIFARYRGRTVVDVALVTRSGVLQYRIKYIDLAGRVRQRYFSAQTGALEP